MLKSGSHRISGGVGESDGGQDLHGPGEAVETETETATFTYTHAPYLRGKKRPSDLRKCLFYWVFLR
jgi:hypothetical protein